MNREKKLFISADIEGTAGIASWKETEKNEPDHAYFAAQMTREVAAACRGALAAGYDSVWVKDSHDTARNLDPSGLPERADVLRGWAQHPYCMMFGLDSSFSGVVLTGYHAGARMNTSPLAHTMTTDVTGVTINGELATEAMISCLIAARERVPVLCVSGDRGVCEAVKRINPHIATVAVNEGTGECTRGMHPARAAALIEQTVREAASRDAGDCLCALPDHFDTEITYRRHPEAMRCSFYPGAVLCGANTVQYRTNDLFELLRFYHFTL